MLFAPIIKGLLLGLILSISIGPVIFAIIKQSLTNGKRSGYAFVAGVSSSDLVLLFICNVFTSLFNLVLNHKSTIALAGAGFLLLMGLYTLFFKKLKLENMGNDGQQKVTSIKDLIGAYFSGFLMNTLNPSVFLFWFAWTAAINNSAGDTPNPLQYKLLVFGTCLGFVLLSDLVKVFLAGKLRPRLTEKSLVWINRISGIIILIFSAALLYSALLIY
ncbi:MAG: LysE family transporter [Sediminibacterium sp.]|jgi:threonine/homoserine/homoserine lactone efflux protein|nr:LysE family transporter [Sediminibacterium sp.]